MRTTGKAGPTVLFFVMLLSPAEAAARGIPPVGQPTPFYGAAGKAVKVEASADPVELAVDGSLTYTLRVRDLANAAEVQRPDLNEIDAFRAAFQIDDLPTADAEPEGTRVFRYRLRPRRADITAIPAFTFPYYDPSIAQPPDRPDFPFRKVRANPIPVRVTKKSAPPLPPVRLDVPDFAESPASGSSRRTPAWAWWLAGAMPPVLALGWCAIWRAMNPAGARLARRRRSRAARAALRTLHALGRQAPADTAAIVGCVAGYLAERFDLPGVFRTPDELAHRLREAGADADTVTGCVAFVRAADAARFAPSPDVTGEALIADAERLVRRLEGEA